jgi:hypothetical protein
MFATEPLCLVLPVFLTSSSASFLALAACSAAQLSNELAYLLTVIETSTTHMTPATTSLIEPEPLLPRTLTATTSAALATPYFFEAMVPAQCVP